MVIQKLNSIRTKMLQQQLSKRDFKIPNCVSSVPLQQRIWCWWCVWKLLKFAKCKNDLYFDCTFYANICSVAWNLTRTKVDPYLKVYKSHVIFYIWVLVALSLSYLFCVIFFIFLVSYFHEFFRMQSLSLRY